MPWGFRVTSNASDIDEAPTQTDLAHLDSRYANWIDPSGTGNKQEMFVNMLQPNNNNNGDNIQSASLAKLTNDIESLSNKLKSFSNICNVSGTELQKANNTNKDANNQAQNTSQGGGAQGSGSQTNFSNFRGNNNYRGNVNFRGNNNYRGNVNFRPNTNFAGNNNAPGASYYNNNYRGGNFIRGRGNFNRGRVNFANQATQDMLAPQGTYMGNTRKRYPPERYPGKPYCLYHRIYGDGANNCLPPCQFFQDFPKAPREHCKILDPRINNQQVNNSAKEKNA